MKFHGLVTILRSRLASGAPMFVLEADPDLAVRGIRSPWTFNRPVPYQTAVEGLLIRNLGIIRRDYPYMFLLTTDVPGDLPVETHHRIVGGLYDRAFMERFPSETLHFSLGRYHEPDKVFLAGPTVYSRLFEIGRDDITFLWDALLNNVINPVVYYMLYSSRRISLSDLAKKVEECKSRKEFDIATFGLIDLIAYVRDTPHLDLFAQSDRVKVEIEMGLDWALREHEGAHSLDRTRDSAPSTDVR